MKGGVPFRVAFGLSEKELATFELTEGERFAISIQLSEFEGGKWDWHSLRWIEDK